MNTTEFAQKFSKPTKIILKPIQVLQRKASFSICERIFAMNICENFRKTREMQQKENQVLIHQAQYFPIEKSRKSNFHQHHNPYRSSL